jgi:hypothetical protein
MTTAIEFVALRAVLESRGESTFETAIGGGRVGRGSAPRAATQGARLNPNG